MPGAGVAQRRQVDALEQTLARAQQHRRDRDMHLIDQALTQTLLDHIDPATDAHILALGGLTRLRHGDVQALGPYVSTSYPTVVLGFYR